MRLYRTVIELSSASASPWQADTLFGHLCWSLARCKGEAALNDFLEPYRQGQPPVLLSDGFPSGYLPRPRAGVPLEGHSTLPKPERVKRYRELKDRIEARWLTLEEFNRARRGETVMPGQQPEPQERVVSKNQIDRWTNTAGGEGGQLYDFTELWLPALDIYWRIAEGYEPLVREFLEDLQRTGYGKRKSVGYGQIEAFTVEPFNEFEEVPDANGFVTLANFVPAASDPTEGFWMTRVKYGKLGEEAAVRGQPFKRPLIQLAVGSCFYDRSVREWYGRLVSGIATDPQVVQYGYAFPLSMRLPPQR